VQAVGGGLSGLAAQFSDESASEVCIHVMHYKNRRLYFFFTFKDVFVILVVLCVRLYSYIVIYSYCISFGTVFMFACKSGTFIKLLLTCLLTYLS